MSEPNLYVASPTWTAFTPDFVPIYGGVFANAAAAGRYFRMGSTLFLSYTANITDKGDGHDGFQLGLPEGLTVAADQMLFGRENQTTGNAVQGIFSTDGKSYFYNYDNSDPDQDNAEFVISGVLEVN